MRERRRIVLLTAFMALLPGCSSDNELRSGPGCLSSDECAEGYTCSSNACVPGGSSAGECSLEFNSAECTTCLQSQCGQTCGACSGNQECMLFVQCVSACANDACTEACVDAHPEGVEMAMELNDCLQANCGSCM